MKKLEDFGIECQDLALKLDGQGMSSSSIMEEINMKFSADLTIRQIEGFLKRRQNDRNKILKADKNYQTKVLNSWIDGCSQLKKVNSELWTFFYELRKNPEYKDKIIVCSKCKNRMILQLQSYGLLLKTAQQILETIKHSDAVLGKMQKKSLNINYNYVDLSFKISKIIPTLLQKLEKQAIIKIISKKRFRQHYPNQNINFEKEDEESDEEDNEEEQRLAEIEA